MPVGVVASSAADGEAKSGPHEGWVSEHEKMWCGTRSLFFFYFFVLWLKYNTVKAFERAVL